MLNNFDINATDRIPVSELTSGDLGRLAVVTHKENTIIGPLLAYTFSDFRMNAKLGPTYSVAVKLGGFDLYVDHRTEIWLAKS
jgi:hypothetical protein